MTAKAWWLGVAAAAASAACSGGGGDGDGGPGPGDARDHFPLAPGNRWRSELGARGALPRTASTEVEGSKDVGGVAAVVLVTRTPGERDVREYYAKDDRGLLYLGNDDPDDDLGPLLVPYYAVRFPLEAGRTFVLFERGGLDAGGDADGDRIRETYALRGEGVVKAIEDVTAPAGRFSGCARVETTVTVTVTYSRNGRRETTTLLREDAWYAPGVGPVKEVVDATREEQLLSGYEVGAERHGVVRDLLVASGLGPADSNLAEPGRAAVGWASGAYLVVTRRLVGFPSATVVSRFDARGAPLGAAELDDGAWPSVAWNGTAWLLAHADAGSLHAHRLDASGAPVGAPVALGSGFMAAVASDGQGWLVVWAEFVAGQYDLRGALVAADGTTAGAFTVLAAPGEQVFPAVAFDGQAYLVAWRDTRSGSGPAEDTHLYAARVSTSGAVLDPDGFAISTAPGIQDAPAIASNGAGSIVVWGDQPLSPFAGGATIRAARVDQAGALLDGPPSGGGLVVEPRAATYGWPSVALAGPDYRIAWAEGAYEPTAGVYTTRLSPAGERLDAAATRVATPPEFGALVAYPALASDGEAAFVAWTVNVPDKTIAAALVHPPASR